MNRNILIVGLIGLGVLIMSMTKWVIPKKGREFAALFQAAEYQYGIPRFLLAKQAEQESGYDPNIVSGAGAQGIMQIVPKWHPDVNPLNPADAIFYAAEFMRDLYNRFGSWYMALAAYNAGPTALQKRIDEFGRDWLAHMPTETRNYVIRITNDVPV